ncbi:MAG: signal recognition particle protein Srp54 [Nanoarchaeota archaeon]
MVLEKLSTSLKSILKKIARAGFVDKALIEELIKEIQKSLIHADVNIKLVFELTKQIKERALNEKPPAAITQREYLIKVVYEELVKFLGEEKKELNLKQKPTKILLLGLFGSGKTTTAAKIANYYKKRGKKIALIGLDVHRPAAIAQLEQLGGKINIPVFSDKKEKDPVKIYKKFQDEYKKFDMLLIDTAGRDALSNDLIEEIKELNRAINPQEKILVVSADLGQAAERQAKKLHDTVNITGVIITKLDGTARGGGSLTACAISGAPIKFIGIGEKIDDLEEFNPKGFVGRLLGMGDLEALLEKAKEAISEELAEDLGKKFLKGEFNFLDLYEQMQAMSKMGPLTKVIDMIPGMGGVKIPKEMLEGQEDKMKKWKFILQSLTREELENPEILTSSRIERVAKGSGTTTHEVRELLKQYKQSKKLMKMMKGQDPEKLMKRFKGKIPGF